MSGRGISYPLLGDEGWGTSIRDGRMGGLGR